MFVISSIRWSWHRMRNDIYYMTLGIHRITLHNLEVLKIWQLGLKNLFILPCLVLAFDWSWREDQRARPNTASIYTLFLWWCIYSWMFWLIKPFRHLNPWIWNYVLHSFLHPSSAWSQDFFQRIGRIHILNFEYPFF